VQILGNPAHPHNRGGICAKGVAGINLVNDPERLLYPMKRTGARGEGMWTRITWDEVYVLLSQRIKVLIRDGRADEFLTDIGEADPLLERLLASLGSNIVNRYDLENINRTVAYSSMVQSSQVLEDVGRSRLILNFGANPFASHDRFLPMARQIIDARAEKGARVVTFDVRMSETAAQSDHWYPIQPNTDAIVALAMARVILEKNLADGEFIRTKTNTSLAQLTRHLKPYTLDAAERESGVKADVIEKIALEFASKKPSLAISGGGISDHINGVQNVRCISLLNWITGNLEKDGGIFIPSMTDIFASDERTSPRILAQDRKRTQSLSQLLDENRKIDTYFAVMANPAYSEPHCAAVKSHLQDENRVPYLIVMDTHLTETARIADLILPAATYLEGWGLEIYPNIEGDFILNLRQPAVSLLSTAQALRMPDFEEAKLLENTFRPRGEAKEIGNLSIELARRLGRDIHKRLPFKNTKEFVMRSIQTIGGSDIEYLKQNGFWRGELSMTLNQRTSGKDPLQGPGERVSIFLSEEEGQLFPPMPAYEPVHTPSDLDENEFILTTYKSNLWAQGTANSKWAREIFHENRLWINRKAALRLNITNGESVRVTSDVGTLDVRVLTTSRVHPRSVALAQGLGHDAVGNVAKGRKFKSSDLDTSLIWWTQDGNGVNPHKIIERLRDPFGGGYALKDTVVRIEKI
jgi:anaerobic selenocysteine-containing dehydrogenase